MNKPPNPLEDLLKGGIFNTTVKSVPDQILDAIAAIKRNAKVIRQTNSAGKQQ